MRRTIGTSHRGNMRNGLISLLTVVVVISIATAAVLAVSTSHAIEALAQRQAATTTEAYDAERSAQALLAALDAELYPSRGAGRSGAALVAQVERRLNSLLATSCAEGVTATYDIQGNAITCTFVTASGRALVTTFQVSDDATISIEAWKLLSVPQDESTGDVLWQGSAAKE